MRERDFQLVDGKHIFLVRQPREATITATSDAKTLIGLLLLRERGQTSV